MPHRGSIIGLAFLVVLSAAVCVVLLTKSKSNNISHTISNSSQNQTADNQSELSQKEIEELLDLAGEYFIELVRFKGSYKYDEYWQYDSRIKEIVNELGTHNHFVLESWFRSGTVGESDFRYDQYYRLLVGPFNEEEALKELNDLVKSGYKDASIQQIARSDESYPIERHRLLFLYTKNEGPKFISCWVYLWFGYIEYAISNKTNRLLFHSVDTNHGDRGGGRLFLVDGKDGKINPIGDFRSQGLVILPNTQTALVHCKLSYLILIIISIDLLIMTIQFLARRL